MIRKWIFPLTLFFTILIISFWSANHIWAGQKCDSIQRDRPIDVSKVMDTPECFSSNPIEIAGIVSKIYSDKKSFVLVDLTEKDDCDDGCPIKRLPVSWHGQMPVIKSLIVVSGKVENQTGKFIFNAEALKSLPKKDVK